MSLKTITGVLAALVADAGTLVISYPSGTNRGDYLDGVDFRLVMNQAELKAPKNFTYSLGASSITITNRTGASWPAGSSYVAELQIQGGVGPVSVDGKQIQSYRPLNVALLSLGAPALNDADGVAASQSVSAGAEFDLDGALLSNSRMIFDVPRNVVAAWTTASVLTITGKDQYGNTMVEVTASGTSHTGSKAFKEITSITSSASITGATVGTGVKIGLPVFLPAKHMVLGEVIDGALASRSSEVVRLSGRMLEAAVDAGTAYNLVSPVAGRIKKLYTISQGSITTGGGITVEVNTVAVDGLSVTVADGAAEGEVDSDTPTEGHATAVVAVGDRIEIIPAAAFNASADIDFILEIEPDQTFVGTVVVGSTSQPSGTTGDVRGTYTPAFTPDGSKVASLLVALPDPTYLGAAQYTG